MLLAALGGCCGGGSSSKSGGATSPGDNGVTLNQLFAIAIEADGKLLVADEELAAVLRVSANPGLAVVSWCTERTDFEAPCTGEVIGDGLPLFGVRGIEVEADGSIVVTLFRGQAVVQIDPDTGDRKIILG